MAFLTLRLWPPQGTKKKLKGERPIRNNEGKLAKEGKNIFCIHFAWNQQLSNPFLICVLSLFITSMVLLDVHHQ